MSFNEIWAGLDVSKATFDATLMMRAIGGLREFGKGCFTRDVNGVEEFLRWSAERCGAQGFASLELHVAMEATGKYSGDLAKTLARCSAFEGAAVQTSIVNPLRIKHFIRSLGLKNSNDSIDSRAIALFGLERNPPPLRTQDAVLDQLKELVRTRADIVEQRTAMGNRLKEASQGSESAKAYADIIKAFDKQLARLERTLKAIIKADSALKVKTALLDSIPGVAVLTAATLMAELGDLARFGKRSEAVAFAGLNPSLKSSGTSVWRKGGISKQGSSEARRVLYLAAQTAIHKVKKPNPFKLLFSRKIAEGKPYASALVACMRKMLLIARAILKTNQPFSEIRGLT